ncbi:hypothetical protein RIF29_18573 [Crotalaria pallida]|uniref:Uncharacterized protein n=1 Tax=Crotalaria pallida TaxID=3830 RepID=A0AAN9IKT5_CROPI
MQMQSVSDPKSSCISPTRHTSRFKPPSSKLVVRIHGRNDDDDDDDDDEYSSSSKSFSPYYKGLTDQSLAILDHDPLPHTHTHPPPSYQHHHHPNLFASSSSSPYYKGLTDYSLVTAASWTPDAAAVAVLHNTNSLSSYESSPYYRGLIDYSLALHTTNSHLSINIRTPTGPRPDFTLKELMVNDDVDNGLDDIGLIEKGLEPSKVVSGSQENEDKTISEEVALMTKGGGGNDVELVIEEEKALRESKVEENTEKTAKGVHDDDDDDDVRLVIEEKPLRERVPEKSILEEMDLVKEEELEDLSVPEQTAATELTPKVEKLKDTTAEEGNVNEYKWAKKYQPKTLAEFICNRDKALGLKELVKEGCGCNHFIFEGPPSVGKRSMIRAMLREVFGADRVQIIEECKEFKLKGEMVDNLQVRIKKSLHHVEVNLSETKGYEKHVIVDLFKETYGKIINNSLPCSPENCQEKEGIRLSRGIVKKIISRSKNNLRQALRSLEATCRNKDALKDDDLILTGWEHDISNIAKNIIEEQSPRQLYVIRRKLQSLMIHDVSPDFIYKSLVTKLMSLVDESLRLGVAKLDNEYSQQEIDPLWWELHSFGTWNNMGEVSLQEMISTRIRASDLMVF